MNIIKGDLIKLAKEGKFDVIAHGCNCFCTMGAGIAPQMAKAFGCDQYALELRSREGEVDKLGRIDYQLGESPVVINAYTQYGIGKKPNGEPALDYAALTLCLRKINHLFKGQHIGLPQIGCGLAGGNWQIVKSIIEKELCDMEVTIVEYDSN